MSVRVAMSPAIYDPECVDRATQAYSEVCCVRILERTPKRYCIEIEAIPGKADETRATREFLNYLLDLSVESFLSRS